MTRRQRKPWHTGSYHVRSRHIRTHAYANPHTRCWRCGQTYTEYATIHGHRAARWTAGHLDHHDPHAPILPEHARCNASDGATYGNRQRQPQSEDW